MSLNAVMYDFVPADLHVSNITRPLAPTNSRPDAITGNSSTTAHWVL